RTRRISNGIDAGRAAQSGSNVTTRAKTSVAVSPLKAGFPVNISYNAHPNAHTSDARPASLPLACSGDIYAAVPKSTPGIEAALTRVGEFDTSGTCPS